MKTPPPITLPQGVRDILPEEAERIAKVESAILSTFKRYGFRRVITPLLEYVDTLSLGMGRDMKTKVLKFMEPGSGMVMAIRPDITPQIARLVATRMRDYPLPLKLYYNENVFRYADGGGERSKEILQIGAECVSGDASPEADSEMVVMAIDALKKTGLKDFKIDIGDVGFVKKVLARLAVPDEEKRKIKDAIAKKDNSGLESILKTSGGIITGADRKLLLSLATFYGEKEVIKKAMSFSKDPALKESLEYLKKTIDIIGRKGCMDSITIDLGEVRGFDYYTGIIFEGFAENVGTPILSGGRYDTLLEKYGYPVKSTGFAFDVEDIVTALGGNSL
ncbi:MAG: ATP phosphoribosyltransferase regulatory subunit [Deltaproteobacteria bacterium]|nr:ATP phosphoribosyltransferase regulatory subunit [Deltaproteobacteria bacterium]